jgi:hypothetical protein
MQANRLPSNLQKMQGQERNSLALHQVSSELSRAVLLATRDFNF